MDNYREFEQWQLVPIEPSEQMLDVWQGFYDGSYNAEYCYKEMLKIAPQSALSNSKERIAELEAIAKRFCEFDLKTQLEEAMKGSNDD